MKTLKYSIVLVMTSFLVLIGCKKEFNNFVTNPNPDTQVPPSIILRSILSDMYSQSGDRNYAPFSQSERENQFTCSNYTYYDNNQYWSGSATWDYSTTLTNVLAMEKEAARVAGTKNTPYHALGKFFRAWFFTDMTMKVGDLPLSQSLLGVVNVAPKYDTQKQVFQQCFAWLDSSNTQLAGFIANGFNEFSGDIYHTERPINALSSRDALIAWQKTVNTFRLRLLINLSKKVSDPDLKVATQFANIYNNPTQYPIMGSMNDNLQYEYIQTLNPYPNSPLNFGNDALRYNMAGTYLNILSATNDLRAMIVAEPARGLGLADTAYGAFQGAPSGEDLGTMTSQVQSGKISLIGRHRYWETQTAESCFILSYPEMCFNIAEAANRGWITANPETWYKLGIQASQGFYGIVDGANTVTFQAIGGLLGQDISYTKHFTFANFYAQPSVQYSTNVATGLAQIQTQKYLAFFRNSGLQAYYEWRRTGVPAFNVGTGSGNSSRIPLRFQYPTNEQNTNSANWTAALANQGYTGDDLFGTMWILK
jgi:hypothetical protein